MAIYLESFIARYLVGIYFECRKNGTYPSEGPWGHQTAFAHELFEFLDGVRGQTDAKNHAAALKSQKPKK